MAQPHRQLRDRGSVASMAGAARTAEHGGFLEIAKAKRETILVNHGIFGVPYFQKKSICHYLIWIQRL